LYRALLLDFYGALLTERQFSAYESNYLNDMSLNEIADSGGVSAQSVWDLVRRGEKLLEGYEAKLALINADEKRNELICRALAALETGDYESVKHVLAELREV
jgi:predicted DNA-binding protein YlxM (UPF0122 family)